MAAKKDDRERVFISPPNMALLHQRIRGTAPYVQARFADKARREMEQKHKAGSTARKGGKKEARDFMADYEGAMHRGPDGEYGMPAAAFRAAAISACRLVSFKMTLAKLALFVEADFHDPRDGTPLAGIEGDPRPFERTPILPVRNTTGVADLRCRPMWDAWAVVLRLRFDADVFRTEDVVNLLARIGAQVGVGEGRADSKNSSGMGWGHFELDGAGRVEKVQIL